MPHNPLVCAEYVIQSSDCPCILKLENQASNHVVVLNLREAIVRDIPGTNHFHIQTPNGGAKVDGDLSAFAAADIEELICKCSPDLSGPATDAAAVTPSDVTVYDPPYKSLYVGGLGDVAVRTVDGTTVTFVNVQAGTILPIQVDQVRSTGTTATSIVGLL